MFLRIVIALSLVSLLVHGVVSDGLSPSSSNLRPRLVNHSAGIALKSEFSDIHGEIIKARLELERACASNDLKSVQAIIVGFQKSFQGLANSCSKTYNLNKQSPAQFARQFVNILVEFQPLLKTLNVHPPLLAGCSNVFRSSSTSINAMISFLKAGKVDLNLEVRKAKGSLDLKLYAQSGFRINSFS